MEKIFVQLRNDFINELHDTEGSWRVLRISSLADILLYNYYCYENNHSKSHLNVMFNVILKIKISYSLGELKISNNLPNQIEKMKGEKDKIIRAYDDQIKIFKTKVLPQIDSASNLFKEMNYLKVVCDLGIDSYSDDIFDTPLLSVFRLIED